MSDLLYLSLRYIQHHRLKIAVLTLAITLVCWLPIAIQTMVDKTAEKLLNRAQTTPLVIGSTGSPLELSLGSLYFRSRSESELPYTEVEQLEATGLASAIPLHFRFSVQDYPVVGTTPAYFAFRQLPVAEGRQAALLGEAVIGAGAASALGLSVGDHVISSPESVFDLAGAYPLKMPIVGILAPSLSPDDDAIFVDLKTSWVIQGLGHGHQDLNQTSASGQILSREGDNLVANASVRQYNEITSENLDSFHFHGSSASHPVSAIIPLPENDKSAALLLGRYQEERQDIQIVRTGRVIGELLDTVFTVRDYIVIGIALVGAATGLIALLVFYLSLRLRKGERHTLANIGASRQQVQLLMATEVLTVIVLSALFAALLVYFTGQFGLPLMQQVLLS